MLLLTGLLLLGMGACAAAPEAPAETPAQEVEPEEPAPAPDEIDPNARRLADAKRDIRTRKLGVYGMVPIYGTDVADGVYPIHVDSSSPFFRIAAAELIVENGEMYGRITIPSMSYLWVYPGTKEEAAAADPADWLGFEEVEHHTVFTIPVRALDTPVKCAAYSKARELWYDRDLVFYASSLPAEALAFDLPDYELIEAAIRAYDLEGTDYLLSAPVPAGDQSQAKPDPVQVDLPDGSTPSR